jgi:hypothetical protein
VLPLKTTELQADKATIKLPFLKRAKAVVSEGRLISGLKRRLKPIVLAVLNSSPELKNRLYRLVWKDIALSPRAMRIYTALSTAIPTHSATHSKGND